MGRSPLWWSVSCLREKDSCHFLRRQGRRLGAPHDDKRLELYSSRRASVLGATNTGGAWLCAHLWEHYLYTQDKEYLQRIYPILKGAADFFRSTMVREPGNGWLVTAPTSSPENSFYMPGDSLTPVSICMGPTMDVQLLTELYYNVIVAALTLNRDADYVKKLEADLKEFPPMIISKDGYLQEWLEDYREAEVHHRHVFHLYGLHPETSSLRPGHPSWPMHAVSP